MIREDLKKYYDKYWIASGMKVIHIEHLAMVSPVIMWVDYLLKKSVTLPDGKRKNIIVGVMLHHWNKEQTEQIKARCNTKELIPEDIWNAGTAELQKWSEYQSKINAQRWNREN